MLNEGRDLGRGEGMSRLVVKTASPCCVGGEGSGGGLAPVFSTHSISIVLAVLGTGTVAGTWLS